MARIRTIKPEFWTDGDMLKLSRDARLFYIGLWNFTDDNGILEYDPISIKARIFPNDRVFIGKLLEELIKINKVLVYEVEKRQYIFIKSLANHQVIDRPRKSYLPLPNGNQLKSIEISPGKEGRKEGKGGINEIKFTPPTLEEIKNYCKEKSISINTERFINFYESKGWMVGKNKMKDWKAAVRGWGIDSKPKLAPRSDEKDFTV